MPTIGRIVADTVGGDSFFEFLPLETVYRDTIAHFRTLLKRLDIEHGAGFNLHLHVAGILAGEMLYVLVGGGEHLAAGRRNDVTVHPNRHE